MNHSGRRLCTAKGDSIQLTGPVIHSAGLTRPARVQQNIKRQRSGASFGAGTVTFVPIPPLTRSPIGVRPSRNRHSRPRAGICGRGLTTGKHVRTSRYGSTQGVMQWSHRGRGRGSLDGEDGSGGRFQGRRFIPPVRAMLCKIPCMAKRRHRRKYTGPPLTDHLNTSGLCPVHSKC